MNCAIYNPALKIWSQEFLKKLNEYSLYAPHITTYSNSRY